MSGLLILFRIVAWDVYEKQSGIYIYALLELVIGMNVGDAALLISPMIACTL